MAESEIDGGESLDPRPGATAIAAAEPEDEVTVDAEAPAVEASAEPAEAGDNAADPTPMVFDDDTFSGEEIVIEIGDDD